MPSQAIGRVGATTELIEQHIEQADGQQVKKDLLLRLVEKIPVRICTWCLEQLRRTLIMP